MVAAGVGEFVGAGSSANACRAGEIRGQARSHGAFVRRASGLVVNEKSRHLAGFSLQLVPRRGLEPPRLAALVPETSASTNSAIWAGTRIIAKALASVKGCRCDRIKQARSGRRSSANRHAPICMQGATALRIVAAGEPGIAPTWRDARRGQQKSRSEERLSCETGAQKRTRTSTPRSAST